MSLALLGCSVVAVGEAVGLHAAWGCTMYIQYNRGIFIYYHNKQIVSILDYYTNNSSMMM